MPGWPTNPEGHFNDVDIAGYQVVELSKDNFKINIGGMSAHNYFGDGSLYILDAPGHSLGHINALACTNLEPESFILLAADSVHMGGEFRPSDTVPLPHSVEVEGLQPCPCPAENLLKIHPRNSRTLPFLGLDPCIPEDLGEAQKTIECIRRFDVDERVFVIFAHDASILDVVDYFPKTANAWRQKGWKMKARWAFLPFLQQVAGEDGDWEN